MSAPSRLPRFHNHFPPMIRRCPQRRFLTSHPRQPHAARHTHTHTHTHTGRSRLPFRHPYPPLRTVRRWRRQYYLLFPLVSVFSAAAANNRNSDNKPWRRKLPCQNVCLCERERERKRCPPHLSLSLSLSLSLALSRSLSDARWPRELIRRL